MKFSKLPGIKEIKPLSVGHFPNRFYAAVFRLWETVDAKQIAKALSVTEEKIREGTVQGKSRDWSEDTKVRLRK